MSPEEDPTRDAVDSKPKHYHCTNELFRPETCNMILLLNTMRVCEKVKCDFVACSLRDRAQSVETMKQYCQTLRDENKGLYQDIASLQDQVCVERERVKIEYTLTF